MLDIKYIRENPDKIKDVCKKRQIDCNIDYILELDKKRREHLQEIEGLKAEQNKLGKDDQEKAKEIKNKIKELEPVLNKVEEEFNELLIKLPNLIADDVPEGKDESGNKVLRKFKEPTKFSFNPKDHMQLGIELKLIDT